MSCWPFIGLSMFWAVVFFCVQLFALYKIFHLAVPKKEKRKEKEFN